MNKYIQIVFYFFLSIFLFSSCENESINPSDLTTNEAYFPLKLKGYIVYSYDSVGVINKGLDKIVTSGFIKHEISEVIKDTKDTQVYKLVKYWKKNKGDGWRFTDVEVITKTKSQIIQTEENLPFIKIIFPLSAKSKWNGNALFDQTVESIVYGEPMKVYNDWDYKAKAIDEANTINGVAFGATSSIVEVDRNDILNRRYSKSIYAKDIGLVYKEMEIFDTQKTGSSAAWKDKAEKGFSLIYRYEEHK